MFGKLKLYWFYFLSSLAAPRERYIKKLQAEQEHRINSIKLTDARAEKAELMAEWIKPENIAKRAIENEEQSQKSLVYLTEMKKRLGVPEDPPLPPMEILPAHIKIQQPSMMRIMLDCEGWAYDWDKKEWVH